VFVKLVKYTVLEISAVGALSRSSGLSEVILFPIVCFLVQPSISHAFTMLGNARTRFETLKCETASCDAFAGHRVIIAYIYIF
jgi:hypothetical protein